MKVIFYAANKSREHMLAHFWQKGIGNRHHSFELRSTEDYNGPDSDVAIFFGVKSKSRMILDDHLAAGCHTIMLDKGYTRTAGEGGHTKYSRVIVDGLDPSRYMMRELMQPDRFGRLNIHIAEKRVVGEDILYCGSTQKYCDFHGLGDMTEYAESVYNQIRDVSGRRVIYRPKPSSQGVAPVVGMPMHRAKTSITEALRECHAVVTHGSSAAMDAMLAGVPIVVLGGSVASPMADKSVTGIDTITLPDYDSRFRWASALAYCQWTNKEMMRGAAWKHCLNIINQEKNYK